MNSNQLCPSAHFWLLLCGIRFRVSVRVLVWVMVTVMFAHNVLLQNTKNSIVVVVIITFIDEGIYVNNIVTWTYLRIKSSFCSNEVLHVH